MVIVRMSDTVRLTGGLSSGCTGCGAFHVSWSDGCGAARPPIDKDDGDPRPFADRCPIGWRVQSNICLNSDTPETPDDAQESRTILTKNHEMHLRLIGAVSLGHTNFACEVREVILELVFFLPMAPSIEIPAHLFSHSLSG